MAPTDMGILTGLMFIYLLDVSLGTIANDPKRIPTTVSLFDLHELKASYQIIYFDQNK
jgi:hypothetical protein